MTEIDSLQRGSSQLDEMGCQQILPIKPQTLMQLDELHRRVSTGINLVDFLMGDTTYTEGVRAFIAERTGIKK